MKKQLFLTLALVVASFVSFAQTWVINGPTAVCGGDQDVYYNVQSSTGGLPPMGSYTWKLDGTTVGMSFNPNINLDIPTTGSSFSLEVFGPSSLYASLTLTESSGNPGTVSLSGGSCSGGSLTIQVSGNSGSLKWQRKIGGGSWADHAIGFPDPLGENGLTVGTQYQYRVRTNSSCAVEYSNVLTVTPRNPTSAGTVSGGHTICYGSSPSNNLTGSSPSGGVGSYSYSWSKRVSGGSWVSIGGGSTLTPSEVGTLTQTTEFKRQVTDSQCGSAWSTNTVTITVDASTVAGTISGTSNRCGSGSESFSISGHTGTIQRWQSRYKNGSGSWTSWSTFQETDDQTSVSTSLSQWNSGQRTYEIRAVVKSGVCTTLYPKKTVTVDPATVAGIVSGSSSRCSSGSETFTISGYTGTIHRWQSRYKNGSGSWTSWSTFEETNNVTSVNPSLSQWNSGTRTYEIRAVVKSGSSCSTLYPKKSITVSPTTVAGTISGNSNRCGSGTENFSISGYTGTIQRWQSRYKNGSGSWTSWNTFQETDNQTSVSTSLSQWNGGQRTYEIQAVVKSGVCSTLYPKKTITVDPATVSGTVSGPGSRCGSGNASYSISGHTGTILKWESRYKNGSGSWSSWTIFEETDDVSSVNISLSQWSSGTRTYEIRARVKSGSNCSTSYPKKSTTVNPIPTLAGGTDNSRCGSGLITLSATPGTHANSIRWYAASSGGAVLHTGTSYSPSISSNTTYYAASYNTTTGCEDADRKAIAATIDPIPGLASGSGNDRCGTGTVNLSASPGSNANTIRWYSGSSGGSVLFTGTSFTTPSISSTTTYYAASYNSSTQCEDVDRKAITATINPIPGTASGNSGSRCGTGTVAISASVGTNGNTIRWYSASSGGSVLYTGTNFVTPSISSTTTYYAATYNTTSECESTSRVAVTAIINPIPGIAGANGNDRCGTGSVSISATPGSNANSIRWYSASSGGTLLYTGTNYTTPSISTTTTYYAASFNTLTNCEDPDRAAVVATINPIPGLASGNDQSRCGPGAVALSANTGTNGNTIRWYTASTGGSLLHTGTSYTTPSISTTTTYYAATYNSTTLCEDPDRIAIDAIINDIPSLASGSNVERCGSGAITLSASPGLNGNTIKWYSASSGGTLLHTGTNYPITNLTNTTTYYAASYHSSTFCEDTDRKAITATVIAPTNPGTLSSADEFFGIASGTLNLSGETGDILKWQYKTTGGWVDISNTSDSHNYTNIVEPTSYRVQVQNDNCTALYSNEILINILQIPSVDLGIQTNVRPGAGTTLTTDSGHANYQWFRDGVSVQNGGSNAFTVTHPGMYKVIVTSGGGAVYETGEATISNQLEMNENSVITYTYRVPVQNANDPFAFSPDQQSIAAQVYDGLGRPIQQVSMDASPQMKDVVVPMEYDAYGRRVKNYLPYVDTDVSVLNKANALNTNYAQSSHYDYYVNESTHASDKAFSEVLLETSPLNRPIEQGAPGGSWQLGQNTVKFAYGINSTNEVIEWKAATMLSSPVMYYDAGELFRNTTIDEDGNATVEYADKQGQTILKKSMVDVVSNDTTWAETYYIYDIYGQLVVVIPPEASDRLSSEFFGQSVATREDFLNTWAFLYDYDGRNRMTMKKVPGADSVFMVYDRWDRLVLTQDGNQRNAGEWLFTKYDDLNRPIMTGIMESGRTTDGMRSTVAASTQRFDTLDATQTHQYHALSFPTDSISEYLTVTYYDDYDYQTHSSWSGIGFAFSDPEGQLTHHTGVKGQVTGTMTKAGDGSWIRSVSYYDDKYRMIQSQSTNHLGGKDVVTNYYDFIGQVNRSISSHSNGSDTTNIARSFSYDHAGRLLETEHALIQDVNWTDMVGVDVSSNDLVKTASSQWDNGGAASIQKLSPGQNGYFEFEVTNYNLMVGFSEENANANYTSINYCVYIRPNNGVIRAYRDGVNLGDLGSYSVGDIVRVERKNSVIQIKQNGNLLYTFADSVSSSLILDATLYQQNAVLSNVTFAAGATIATNSYNELGELIEKDLHSGTQSLDYTYNIRGWLTSVNEADLSQSNDGDLFGMELLYDAADGSLSNSQLYNGNISAMKWSDYDAPGAGISERAYTYGYDQLNRLKTASHFEDNASTNKYGVQGLNYDLNGNIESLQRRSTGTSTYMDDLTYAYTGNQLQYVSDASTDSLGFLDGNTSGNDYAYDANGNMVKDKNKGIDSIYYNHLNLPVAVILNASEGSQDSIAYLYDAAGIKLQQKVFKNDTLRKTTDYVGEFIYETDTSGIRELQIVQHEEGRIVPKDTEWDYQYHLKDHLGNVRMTFSTTPENYEMIATMEDSNETEMFSNYVADPDGAIANSGTYVSRNSNLVNSGLDLNTFLSVNKGDTIRASAYAYYNDGGGSYNLATGLIETALFGSFNANYGAEGATTTQTNFDNAFGSGTALGDRSTTSNEPPAYINYIFFDKEMGYVTASFSQITSASNGQMALVTATDFIPDRDGYVMIYLSNETSGSELIVSWDDFTVYHGKTNVVSTQDYYPGGLTFNSYTRTASTPQNYLYQGKELQSELTTYDFNARMYDPAIWRTFQPDPMSDLFYDHSPYSWVKNNPLLRIDPTGMTDFTFDKKTGEVAQVGEANDEPDRILKTNRKGEVKYKKNGEAKVAMGGIEQGILADGQNWKTDDQIIEVGGEGQASVDGVQSFTLGLSEYIGKEISGYSYSSTGSGTTDVLLGKYENNSKTESSSSLAGLIKKYRDDFSFNNVTEAFHTHPDGKLGATQSAPHLSADVENLQRDKPVVPNAIYFILYRVQGQSAPEKYDYTHEYRAPKKKK